MPFEAGRHSKLLFVLTGIAAFLSTPCLADGDWAVKIGVSDKKETKVDEVSAISTEDVKRNLAIDYKTEFSTSLEGNLGFSIDYNKSIVEDKGTTEDIAPKIKADLKSNWWSIASNWDHKVTNKSDPTESEPHTKETKWDADFKIEPESDLLPQLDFKITGDDTKIDKSAEGSFEYGFLELVDVNLKGKRALSENRDTEDDDTVENAFSTDLKFSNDFWENWKFESGWKMDRSQKISFDSNDIELDRTDSLKNDATAKLQTQFLSWIDVTSQRDWKFDKDLMQSEPSKRTDTLVSELKMAPEIGEALSVELDYKDTRDKTSNTDSDAKKWKQEYKASSKLEIFKLLATDGSYSRTIERESPAASDESYKRNRNDEWKIDNTFTLLEDQIAFKVSRNLKYSWELEEEKTSEHKWDYDLKLKFEDFPNLKVNPSYVASKTINNMEGTTEAERKYEFEVVYAVELGKVVKFDLNHKYSRNAKYPEALAQTLERTDTSSFKVGLNDFLKDMTMESEAKREVKDKSLDELGPEKNLSYTFKYTWSILQKYELGFDYQHDVKDLSEDTEKYSADASCKILNDDINLKFEHIKEIQLEGERKQTFSYLVELTGDF